MNSDLKPIFRISSGLDAPDLKSSEMLPRIKGEWHNSSRCKLSAPIVDRHSICGSCLVLSPLPRRERTSKKRSHQRIDCCLFILGVGHEHACRLRRGNKALRRLTRRLSISAYVNSVQQLFGGCLLACFMCRILPLLAQGNFLARVKLLAMNLFQLLRFREKAEVGESLRIVGGFLFYFIFWP